MFPDVILVELVALAAPANRALLVGRLQDYSKWIREANGEIVMFHNFRSTNDRCSSKAKMSALSKVEMSVSAPFWEFGGCHFDGHGGDEQARAKPS